MDEDGALSRLGPILSPYSLNPCLSCPLSALVSSAFLSFSLSLPLVLLSLSLFFGFWIRRAGLDVILSDIVLLLPPLLFHFNPSNRPTAFCGTQPSPPKTTTPSLPLEIADTRFFRHFQKNLRQPIASRPVTLVYYFYRLDFFFFFYLIPHIDHT